MYFRVKLFNVVPESFTRAAPNTETNDPDAIAPSARSLLSVEPNSPVSPLVMIPSLAIRTLEFAFAPVSAAAQPAGRTIAAGNVKRSPGIGTGSRSSKFWVYGVPIKEIGAVGGTVSIARVASGSGLKPSLKTNFSESEAGVAPVLVKVSRPRPDVPPIRSSSRSVCVKLSPTFSGAPFLANTPDAGSCVIV